MTNLIAWVTLIIILFCCFLYPLRIIITKYQINKKHFMTRFYQYLLSSHKFMGLFSILLTFVHCSVSRRIINQSSILGIFLLVILILLFFTYCLRKKLKKKWIVFHRLLSVILLLGLFTHSILEFNI